MRAETRALLEHGQSRRRACRVSGRWQGENIPCNRCGPGGWPGPHLFWTLQAPYVLGATLPISRLRHPAFATVETSRYHGFVFSSPEFFHERRRTRRNQQPTTLSHSPAASRKLLDAFHQPRKFTSVEFSEVLIHSSRMTSTKIGRTFMHTCLQLI
jgi:hypothetical protein